MNRTIIILISLLSCNSLQKEKDIDMNDKFERIMGNKSFGYIDQNGDTIIPLEIYERLDHIDNKGVIYAKKKRKIWLYQY